MRWILYILVFLALLVLTGFLFPREVTVERGIYIAMPPQAVFPYVNNLRHFNRWSPWYQLDPDTEYRYSGPESGTGATMSWSSNNSNVGSGTQTISVSEPYSLVRTELQFDGQGGAIAEFRLQPREGGTDITWRFSSDMGGGPVARWMGLLVGKMVGESYEQGLSNLKSLVESAEEPLPESDMESDVDLPTENGKVQEDHEELDAEMSHGTTDEEGEEEIEENP